MKRIAWIVGVLGLLGSVGYLFSYVIRWQWNRALFAAAITVALLVLLGTAAVLRKLERIETAMDADRDRLRRDPLLEDLQATRPQRDHFAWLRERTTTPNVFITVLLGGGVVVSAIAWVVGKIGEGTTTPAAERRLVEAMDPLRFPDEGLQPSTDAQFDPATLLLRRPTTRSRR